MEDLEYKGLIQQFGHDIGLDDFKNVDKKNLKRSEQTKLDYYCTCRICILQSKHIAAFYSISKSSNYKTSLKELKGFTWLLEKLGEISIENTFKLNIPDTAVFKKGKPAFLIQYQRDRSIKYINSGEKITNQEIIKNLTNIVRNRKKEENLYRAGKIRPSSAVSVEYGKETACIKFMSKNKDNELEDIFAEDEEGATRVMNENEFTGLMWQRPGSNFWKTIAYIQSALKCKKGIGETFLHAYVFEHVNSSGIIQAGLDDNEENEEIIYLRSKTEYCEYIFKKIYYLFEKYLNLMLLQIKGEFLRDDNNRIWLISASNILCVPIKITEVTSSPDAKPLPITFNDDQLLTHLAQVSRQPKNQRTEKFSKIMNQEFEKIIDSTKIMDIFKPPQPDEVNISAFSKLRKFTPYNLEDLLDPHKAKALLNSYTEKNRNKNKVTSEVKGIDYENQSARQNSFSPKKTTNSWIFTPKVSLSPTKIQKRPMSSGKRFREKSLML
jgi:hypothetical protein